MAPATAASKIMPSPPRVKPKVSPTPMSAMLISATPPKPAAQPKILRAVRRSVRNSRQDSKMAMKLLLAVTMELVTPDAWLSPR